MFIILNKKENFDKFTKVFSFIFVSLNILINIHTVDITSLIFPRSGFSRLLTRLPCISFLSPMIFKSIRKIPRICISVSRRIYSKVENRGKGGRHGDRRVSWKMRICDAWIVYTRDGTAPHPSSTSAASHNSRIHPHANVHDTMEATGT